MTTYQGAAGAAAPVLYDAAHQRAAETLAYWLLTAPDWHPAWSQYLLLVVRLRDDVPGYPPPRRTFPDATHELLVVAADPTGGIWTPQDLARRTAAGQAPPFLMPVNVAEQLHATDDEMVQVAEAAAHAVADGHLCPETGDAPDRIRAAWRAALTATLDHFRGGHTP